MSFLLKRLADIGRSAAVCLRAVRRAVAPVAPSSFKCGTTLPPLPKPSAHLLKRGLRAAWQELVSYSRLPAWSSLSTMPTFQIVSRTWD